MRCKQYDAVLFAALIFGLVYSPVAEARSTFSSIRTIFDTYCTASCHTTADALGGLVLEGTDADVYNALVMKEPVNGIAKTKGDVLVMPGYPEKSFLLRKLNKNGWEDHPNMLLAAGEGDPMPQGFSSLKDEEVELIRQWILFGCPDTADVVDTTVLYNFYNGMGAVRVERPSAPSPTLGFQVKYGPFFLAPHTEREYFIKYALNNLDGISVDRVDLVLHPVIHHFNIEKFIGQRGVLFPEGFREASIDTSDASASMVVATQFSQSMHLPEGSAYSWNRNTIFDMNGHSANTYSDSVVAIEAYVNFYYDDPDANATPMYSTLVNPSFVLDSSAFMLPPGQQVTFTDSIVDSTSTAVIDIWMLTSHTHKYGTSYNIYERDPCGGKGEILYNGNFNQNYTFDQGFFDYEHPSVREFDDMPRIPIKQGIIHEATYFNYGTDTIYFGLTTKDEMMNIFMQYSLSSVEMLTDLECDEDTATIVLSNTDASAEQQLACYPNPFNRVVMLDVVGHVQGAVEWQLIDLLGRTVLQGSDRGIGALALSIPTDLPSAQYILAVKADGVHYRQLIEKQ